MKKSTFLGSTVSVLLLFSVITYSRSLVQQQNPKSTQQVAQAAAPTGPDTATTPEAASTAAAIEPPAAVTTSSSTLEKVTASELYTATAYSLRGRTASGAAASQGIIAADPRVLPIGSRVRIEAGSYTGEYLVADTGGAVRGKRIDIWTPTSREAMHFGRRMVKLTVLQFGGKRSKAALARPQTITSAPPASAPRRNAFYWPGKPEE